MKKENGHYSPDNNKILHHDSEKYIRSFLEWN